MSLTVCMGIFSCCFQSIFKKSIFNISGAVQALAGKRLDFGDEIKNGFFLFQLLVPFTVKNTLHSNSLCNGNYKII